jgi:hypothetical protein
MPKRTSPDVPHRPNRAAPGSKTAFSDERTGSAELPGRDELDDSAVYAELDLVPGNPPVPITTWRTPASEPGMSPALAQRMLIEFSRRGQPVHDATRSAVFARAVASMGRRVAAAGSRTEPAQPAALVVCGWPPDRRGLDPAIALGALRRRLAPDGTLVVFGVPGQDGFDPGTAVRAATAARLAYLQHIVAVYAPTRGECIEPASQTAWAGDGVARHQPVHTDVLVFRQPQALASGAAMSGSRDG